MALKWKDLAPGWAFVANGECYLLLCNRPSSTTFDGKQQIDLQYMITDRKGRVHFWEDIRDGDIDVIVNPEEVVGEP